MAKFVFAAAILLQLVACATPSRQTEDLVRGAGDLPPAHILREAPFLAQTAGHCGPATLTMALRVAGRDVEIEEIAPLVMTESAHGSLQMDMISAARRQGMMAIEIEGLRNVAREVASGTPVIVFQNLGLSWAPRWHYAEVVGYDIPRQEIVLHSGPRAFSREPLRRFERSWSLGEYWAIVILPPGNMSVTAGELPHLKAAAGLEQASRLEEAAAAYAGILERWPESLGALVGAANISYRRADYQRAVALLKRASAAHPESVVARHNLDVAERALNDRAFK